MEFLVKDLSQPQEDLHCIRILLVVHQGLRRLVFRIRPAALAQGLHGLRRQAPGGKLIRARDDAEHTVLGIPPQKPEIAAMLGAFLKQARGGRRRRIQRVHAIPHLGFRLNIGKLTQRIHIIWSAKGFHPRAKTIFVGFE